MLRLSSVEDWPARTTLRMTQRDDHQGEDADGDGGEPLRPPEGLGGDEQPDDHDRGRRRVEHQPQRRWSEPQRPVAPGPEEQVGGERDEERHEAEHPQRHPPRLAAEAERAAPVDEVRGRQQADGEADRQAGEHDTQAQRAPGGRRVVDDHRAVVGVERALAEPGEHPGGDERDQPGREAGDQRHQPGPDQGQHEHLAVPVAIAEPAPRVLGEHVAGEEHRADQAAEGGGVARVADEAGLVGDHPGDHRSGDRPVGVADQPAEQQERPQALVLAAEHGPQAGTGRSGSDAELLTHHGLRIRLSRMGSSNGLLECGRRTGRRRQESAFRR